MVVSTPAFDRELAFSRNLGWMTTREQQVLAGKRVAVAGLGGVGGSHLLTLVRMGVGRFNLAEIDTFEVANFNRQAGAMCSTIGRGKLEVLRDMALDIDPSLEIREFPTGVNEANLDDFLDGVDLYADSLDFFAFTARRAVLAACRRRGIPTITAIPVGMGAALICFHPQGISFEDFFCLEGHDELEQSLRLLVGSAPAHLHAGYLVDRSRVDLATHRVPSTGMACQVCAGMAATEAFKILLGRGPVRWAPKGIHFDAYTGRLARTWTPWGNANPLQRLRLAAARRILFTTA